MYHSIDHSGSVVSTVPEVFRRQIETLASAEVAVVPLEEILRLPANVSAVALTFDDGFENFGTTAWPVLRDHDLPCTLFVVAGRAGETNSWPHYVPEGIPEMPLLDWEAIGRLSEEGVTLGSHTLSHANLSSLSDGQLEAEVRGSAELITERTGTSPSTFAYPYGRRSSRATEAVRAVYEFACTADMAALVGGEDPHALPRIDTYYIRAAHLGTWGTMRLRFYLQLRRRIRDLRGRIESSSHGL